MADVRHGVDESARSGLCGAAMKAKRRHELKTNELAQSIQDMRFYLQRRGGLVLGVSVAAILVLIVGTVWRRSAAQARSDAWQSYYNLQDSTSTGALVGAHGKGVTSLSIDGLTASQTPTVVKGYTFIIAGNTQRYSITEDAKSAGAGAATLSITPALVQAHADNDVVTIHIVDRVKRARTLADNTADATLGRLALQLAAQVAWAEARPPGEPFDADKLKQAEQAYERLLATYPHSVYALGTAHRGLAAIAEEWADQATGASEREAFKAEARKHYQAIIDDDRLENLPARMVAKVNISSLDARLVPLTLVDPPPIVPPIDESGVPSLIARPTTTPAATPGSAAQPTATPTTTPATSTPAPTTAPAAQ